MAHYMVHNLANELDTHDKRFMFLKIFFPEFLGLVNLEGSPKEVAFRLVDFFLKQDILHDLEDKFNRTFVIIR